MLDEFFSMVSTATERAAKYISQVEDKCQLLGVSEELCCRYFVSNLEEDEFVHLDVITKVAATMGGPTAGALSRETVVWRASHLITN